MSGRILTLQRQARELGRLRTGTTTVGANGKTRPTRSETWIISSHSEDYIRAAADEWGGQPERWSPQGNGADQWRVITDATALDAILPPGDPLSQANEMWSGGGCQRRCDGVTELLSDQPCLCARQFGDNWHEQTKGTVCSATTRLNVLLPSMPDFGVWRMETHSFYSANEVAATVDVIRSATDGLVPVRLRIEQRTRVAQGKTKQFPVIALELRGATTQQVLSGTIGRIEIAASQPREAITSAPASADFDGFVDAASTEDELKEIWRRADNPDDYALAERIKTRMAALKPPADPNEVWARIMAAVPADWTSADVDANFEQATGVSSDKATAAQMSVYLTKLTAA